MSHPRPATAPPFRLLSAGVPPFLLAQVAPGSSWDHLAWGVAAAAVLGVTVGTVALVQHRRTPWRSRHGAPDIPVLFAPPGPHARPVVPPRTPPAPASPAPASPAPASPAAARPARVGPVRARRGPEPPPDEFPADGTLQVLPGRLEVLAGITRDHPWEQEVRFVRIPGSAPEVTFGRGEGPPHRHVRLASSTVSREHARMRLGDDGWTLHNLSRTNPTLVNGGALAPDGAAVLRDGDRIEMGEVVFRFRER